MFVNKNILRFAALCTAFFSACTSLKIDNIMTVLDDAATLHSVHDL
ncbi:hypothetical protein [Corynebacterium durum]|jgi:lipoprotein|nr:hypothetical protein [Corynebacterium durum]